ncbi:hypothetical protein MMC26_006643 [Xylographa opegraphella]|nr:hypothetical protein [Xylographa opegraphella]
MEKTRQQPTVVFVPGAFHVPAHYEHVIAHLETLSFPSIAVSLPTIGTLAATAGLYDDVQAVRSTLERLVEVENKEVILIPHSYGGNPGCQAVGGLERSKRVKEGKNGGVIHCLFISAFMIPEGETVVSTLGGGLPPWAEVDGAILRPGPMCASTFYNDMSDADAKSWAQKLDVQAASPSITPVKEPCWSLDIPITYMMCMNDQASPVFLQELMLNNIKNPHLNIERRDTGHCPFLSKPEVVVELIEQIGIGTTQ